MESRVPIDQHCEWPPWGPYLGSGAGKKSLGWCPCLSPNESKETLAGRNNAAVLKTRIVQSPLAGCFLFLLF
jgi:hypothetical protein